MRGRAGSALLRTGVILRSGVLLAIVALSGRTLSDCFSRIASARRPEGPAETEAEEALAPAAAAWLRAARRTAEGRKDSAAYWEVAWETTEAWWLRPVAFTVSAFVALGAILQRPDRFLGRTGQALRSEVKGKAGSQDSSETKARKALQGLQRMELPFFATSSSWSPRLGGVVVSANPREGAIENWSTSEVVLRRSVEAELGYPVFLHLLRRDASEAEEGALSRPFELLVREARPPDSFASGMGMMSPLVSLALVWWCSTQNFNYYPGLQVLQPGAELPVEVLLGLVLLGELARTVVAGLHGVSVGPRTFLPSPQLGLLGAFAPAETASPNRSAALATSLAAPTAIAAGSLVVTLLGAVGGFLAEPMALKHSGLVGLGPLSFLSEDSSTAAFVAAQGLLMAALALLPQSPDGRAAWGVLVGRSKAKQLSSAAAYLYPLAGILFMWCFGPGYLSLPFTWALLLTNLSPEQPPPPLEEASEPSESERRTALALLASAAVVAAPLPWGVLGI